MFNITRQGYFLYRQQYVIRYHYSNIKISASITNYELLNPTLHCRTNGMSFCTADPDNDD